jgi:hypothetical protein
MVTPLLLVVVWLREGCGGSLTRDRHGADTVTLMWARAVGRAKIG